MKKIGMILILIGISIIGFYLIYIKQLEKQENNNINNYINDTSIVDVEMSEEIIEENQEEEKQEKSSVEINYTAVLEIPKISLKRGVVDSTNNFSSINYAISVDKNSNYPNEYGNFILYAHSGNSSIAYFKHLNKVDLNDSVYVYFNGIKYHYIIYDKYDIEKTGTTSVISSSNNKYITLITCNQNRKGYQTILIGKIVEEENY